MTYNLVFQRNQLQNLTKLRNFKQIEISFGTNPIQTPIINLFKQRCQNPQESVTSAHLIEYLKALDPDELHVHS